MIRLTEAAGSMRLHLRLIMALLTTIIVGFALAILLTRDGEDSRRDGAGVAASQLPVDSYRQASEARSHAADAAIQALEAAFRAGDRKQASRQATALARLGDDAVGPIGRKFHGNLQWPLRMTLLDVMAGIRSGAALSALTSYYETLKESETALKVEVVRRLGRMAGTTTREALSGLLSKEPASLVREEIARALAALGMTNEEVARLSRSDREFLEQRIIERTDLRSQLEGIEKVDPKGETAIQFLRKPAVEEQVIAVALAAFSKLEARDDGPASALLVERVKRPASTSNDQVIQTNALASLTRMKSADARIAVRAFALGNDPTLRHQSIEILGTFGDKAMLPLLDQVTAMDKSDRMSETVSRARKAIEARAASAVRK